MVLEVSQTSRSSNYDLEMQDQQGMKVQPGRVASPGIFLDEDPRQARLSNMREFHQCQNEAP
jgi:hypothetical protein